MAPFPKHTSRLFLRLLLALGLLGPLSGCPSAGDGCLDPDPKYSFDITGSFTPGTNKVKMGDTVYFESGFPSTLTPAGGSEPVVYTGAGNIGNVITVLEYPANLPRRWAAYDFDYVSQVGEAYNAKDVPTPEGNQQIRYQETGDRYEMRIGIIPKRKGNYLFVLGGAYSNGRRVKGKDRCERASFSLRLLNDQQRSRDMAESWSGSPLGNPGGFYAFTVY